MQQGSGSPYGAPPPPAGNSVSTNFDELGAAVAAAAAGDELFGGGGGGSGGGNRWPRQETLALLKIRSEMDSAFKDATVKGPLWEQVSRKLGELGFKRSGKKCKEKFENVHKYYKRTKEGRAGRQDGKSYRFFNQLEALHTAAGDVMPTNNIVVPNATTTVTTTTCIPTTNVQISAPTPITTAPPSIFAPGVSLSSNTSSSGGFGSESDDEEDDEATEEGPTRETGGGGGDKKRKREEKESAKMMAFFEGMMRQVMERQESMQQKFLETIEKREQDRLIREEAWRRQELSRVAREHEMAAQERAASASRDAAIISFLHKVTGQSVPMPASVPMPVPVSPVTPPSPPVLNKPKSKLPVVKESAAGVVIQQQQQQPPPPPNNQEQQTPNSAELMPVVSSEGTVGTVTGTSSSVDLVSSSRWPKSEVHALINLRSELDSRYQESGPKGPLWEDISAGMKRLGYNRNSKRCKEKWENINKYFKKVKESNKKRPEDAKTCPYFHQLDALYRSKQIGSHTVTSVAPISVLSSPPPPPPRQSAPKPSSQAQNQQTNVAGNNENAGNGGIGSSYVGESGTLKKPEDTVKELLGQSTTTTTTIDYGKLDVDSDNIDEDDDEDDDEEDDEDGDGDGKYRIQFQRPNVAGNGSNGTGGGGGGPSANGSSGKTSGSFLAMVR